MCDLSSEPSEALVAQALMEVIITLIQVHQLCISSAPIPREYHHLCSKMTILQEHHHQRKYHRCRLSSTEPTPSPQHKLFLICQWKFPFPLRHKLQIVTHHQFRSL